MAHNKFAHKVLETVKLEWDEEKGMYIELYPLVGPPRKKGTHTMGTKRITLNKKQKLSSEDIASLERAVNKPVTFDEDSPELTTEQLAEIARIAREKRAESKKPVVALRITPSTLEKAKATGKGYTGFLSRLLDNAINDAEMVKRSL